MVGTQQRLLLQQANKVFDLCFVRSCPKMELFYLWENGELMRNKTTYPYMIEAVDMLSCLLIDGLNHEGIEDLECAQYLLAYS